jgi:hypothetical protein
MLRECEPSISKASMFDGMGIYKNYLQIAIIIMMKEGYYKIPKLTII